MLKEPKSKKEERRHIYIKLTVNGKIEIWSTQRRCHKDEWDSAAKRMKGSKAEARETNAWLETLNARAHACRQELYASGKPFTATHIRKLMQGEELNPAKTLCDIWYYHYSQVVSLIGKDYTPSTMVKYNTAWKAILKYLKLKYQADDIRLDQLDFKFIRDYEVYLKTDYGVQNNTAVHMVRKLRSIVRLAFELGWITQNPFLAHRMKLEEVHRNYLTSSEINQLATKNFYPARLNVVRDLFLFSCYTGLSYADAVKLTPDDLITGEDGDTWIQTHRIKNNNRVRIPLLEPAKKLIDHYQGHPRTAEGKYLLPRISNQKANAYLKDIMKALHWTKVLTYHIARHTFATTVTLTNGVPIETVGQMLGHKNIRTTQHYARVTDTKISKDMQPLKIKYEGQPLYLSADIG
jgi:site-specific recombinase XerD